MPGSSLSKTEKRLRDWWAKATKFPFPVLKSIHINGDPGLRGIKDLKIEFDYPLTVISGRNGCGKSTVLSLAALAFHAPKGHSSINAFRDYYTFSDFFFQGPGDTNPRGVAITWEYRGADTVTAVKRSKWMHYERRHKRPVHYLGMLRSVPAIEQSGLRAHFPFDKRTSSAKNLNDSFRKRLSDIMGRSYSEADVIEDRKYKLRRAQSGGLYSSFNMGAGEDILIELLSLLQETPDGSLVVIEEIELGLHPAALIKLAEHLQEIILEKELQVIVSTHSQHFIDSVPREARLLLQRAGNSHQVIRHPTTRLAVGHMAGVSDPELNIYCEDPFAAALIQSAMRDVDDFSRCRVLPVGSKSEICNELRFHRLAAWKAGILAVWDGDVKDTEISGWIKAGKLDQFNWLRLPGTVPPEKWVVATLDCQEGFRALASELPTTEFRAQAFVEQMRAIDDGHDIKREMARLFNITETDVVRALTRAVSRLPWHPLEDLEQQILMVLEGKQVTCVDFWKTAGVS